MTEQYEFEEHLELYKSLYMSEGFPEGDAEEMSLDLMRKCGIDVEEYYAELTSRRKTVH